MSERTHADVLRRMRSEWPLAKDEGPALDAAISALEAAREDAHPNVDEAMAEEENEKAAISAYEKHMGVSADDPAYGPDLAQWMAGWNAALAGHHSAPMECPHRTRCDCLAGCKWGFANGGAE